MAPLFSKADLNKFWHDVQNEVTLICAKFGKDLFSISNVIGRKTKWPGFLAYLVYTFAFKSAFKPNVSRLVKFVWLANIIPKSIVSASLGILAAA